MRLFTLLALAATHTQVRSFEVEGAVKSIGDDELEDQERHILQYVSGLPDDERTDFLSRMHKAEATSSAEAGPDPLGNIKAEALTGPSTGESTTTDADGSTSTTVTEPSTGDSTTTATTKTQPRVAVVIRGEAFRSDCLHLRQDHTYCSNASFFRQQGITATHMKNVIEPLAAFGYEVDVFISSYKCPFDEEDVWGSSLQRWYSNTTAQVTAEIQALTHTAASNQATTLRHGIRMAMNKAKSNGDEGDKQYQYGQPKYYEFVVMLRFDIVYATAEIPLMTLAKAVHGFDEPNASLVYMLDVDVMLILEWSRAQRLYRGPNRGEGEAWRRMQHYAIGLEHFITEGLMCSDVGWDCLVTANTPLGTDEDHLMLIKDSPVDLAGMLSEARARDAVVNAAAQSCWDGAFDFDNNKCPRRGLGSVSHQFYRAADCLGVREYKQNSEGGIENPEDLAIVRKKSQGDKRGHKVQCGNIPGGCLCQKLVAGFGMDERGCQ
jgi:hypothetical protein